MGKAMKSVKTQQKALTFQQRSLHIAAILLSCGITLAGSTAVHAIEPTPVNLAPDTLPPVHSLDATTNPYRGNPAVLDIGKQAYALACAKCHGEDAVKPGPSADLKLVGRYCGRVKSPELNARCMEDADYYFQKTVREGKVRLNIRHMPAWGDSLDPRLIWAIQTFIESARSAPKPQLTLSPK